MVLGLKGLVPSIGDANGALGLNYWGQGGEGRIFHTMPFSTHSR